MVLACHYKELVIPAKRNLLIKTTKVISMKPTVPEYY
jgi:hypothetical protein